MDIATYLEDLRLYNQAWSEVNRLKNLLSEANTYLARYVTPMDPVSSSEGKGAITFRPKVSNTGGTLGAAESWPSGDAILAAVQELETTGRVVLSASGR